MTRLEDAPPTVYRTIVIGVVAYFAVLGYAMIADDPIALLVANALFGIIAIGVGAVLYRQSSRELDPLTAAATCLVTGGVVQLLWLVTVIPELNAIASLTVFAGVGLYVVSVWRDR